MYSKTSLPEEVQSLDAVPEPFRGVVRQFLHTGEQLQFMVFGPACAAIRMGCPASLLAITDSRWLLATDAHLGSGVVLNSASFADTLSVRLETVLQRGYLGIHYVGQSGGYGGWVQFHTEREHLYRHAIHLLLDGMEAAQSNPATVADFAAGAMHDWPEKFQNSVPDHVPEGRHLLTAVYWPAVYGLFHRELLPEAALAVTDRDLLIVSDEHLSLGYRLGRKRCGTVTTYIPLIRLGEHCFSARKEIDTLEVEVKAEGGCEKIAIQFPGGQHDAIREVMESALQRRMLVTSDPVSRARLYRKMSGQG